MQPTCSQQLHSPGCNPACASPAGGYGCVNKAVQHGPCNVLAGSRKCYGLQIQADSTGLCGERTCVPLLSAKEAATWVQLPHHLCMMPTPFRSK